MTRPIFDVVGAALSEVTRAHRGGQQGGGASGDVDDQQDEV